MSLFLHIPVLFFQSEYVPQQSIFSGRRDRLTQYTWRWAQILRNDRGGASLGQALRGVQIPCVAGEVFGWRLQRLGFVVAAMFFGVSGLGVGTILAFMIGSNPMIGIAGLIVGVALLGLAFVFAHFSLTHVVRFQAHASGGAVVVIWPPKQAAVYETYRRALATWQQAGSPLPAGEQQDAFAEEVQPGWDEAGAGGGR